MLWVYISNAARKKRGPGPHCDPPDMHSPVLTAGYDCSHKIASSEPIVNLCPWQGESRKPIPIWPGA